MTVYQGDGDNLSIDVYLKQALNIYFAIFELVKNLFIF